MVVYGRMIMSERTGHCVASGYGMYYVGVVVVSTIILSKLYRFNGW